MINFKTNRRRSGFFHAKSLEHAMAPLNYISMAIGSRDIEYPIGTRYKTVTRIYQLILFALSALSWKTALEPFSALFMSYITVAEKYKILTHFIMCFALCTVYLITVIFYSEDFSIFIRNLIDIEKTLNRLGIPAENDAIFKKSILSVIASCISISIEITLFVTIAVKLSVSMKFVIKPIQCFFYNYATILLVFETVSFINYNELLKRQLQKVNLMLKGMQIPYPDEFTRCRPKFEFSSSESTLKRIGGPYLNIEEKIDALNTLRTIHRRLIQISRDFLRIYWPRNMAAVIFISFSLIFNFYETYQVLLYSEAIDGNTIFLETLRFNWMLILIIMQLLIIRSSTTLFKEASLAGEILSQFREENSKIEREIEAFSVQVILMSRNTMINYKQHILDHSFFNKAIVSTITYFGILTHIAEVYKATLHETNSGPG